MRQGLCAPARMLRKVKDTGDVMRILWTIGDHLAAYRDVDRLVDREFRPFDEIAEIRFQEGEICPCTRAFYIRRLPRHPLSQFIRKPIEQFDARMIDAQGDVTRPFAEGGMFRAGAEEI